jgi:Lrp/AsnC family transcriptional regulator for asnA, asnC and gidA
MRSLPVRPVTASDSECGSPSARAEIDATDLAIIQILQDDGRTSFTSIAKQLNISEGAVRNRVSQLTESRILKVIGVANPIALGYNAFALIGLNIAPGSDPQIIAQSFSDRDEVTYVVFVAGRFDLLVEVVCETQEQLATFLRQYCYARSDIIAVEPMVGLVMYKSMLKWGQP